MNFLKKMLRKWLGIDAAFIEIREIKDKQWRAKIAPKDGWLPLQGGIGCHQGQDIEVLRPEWDYPRTIQPGEMPPTFNVANAYYRIKR